MSSVAAVSEIIKGREALRRHLTSQYQAETSDQRGQDPGWAPGSAGASEQVLDARFHRVDSVELIIGLNGKTPVRWRWNWSHCVWPIAAKTDKKPLFRHLARHFVRRAPNVQA